ncbi:cupin domain-containing protein [Roseomonas sp. NAR14]|uniref:Cupin domain-containing protein n=1 Tax=Roseomonas acroporae TaxID=2937791 RepID=A0A9X1Y8L7_9PROT|nr:cupin domain-containing protein [Roseomonas acroporae]MCK8784112.1 cupin domain-containing protein [Roseomonas acroporae]
MTALPPDPPPAPASPAAAAFALAFGGMSVESVLRLRETREARHFPADDPARFRALCGVADLDAWLATGAARCPQVGMADGSREGSAAVPPELFTREDGRIDPAGLFARFDGGATLVVSQFQDMHPPLARFCRGLEKLFLHPVQCNVYLTPPGAQGFRTHFDTHDVLVLQVQGEKRWRLFPGQPLPDPTRHTRWDRDRYPPTGEPETLLLRPGDALYVPRGVLHDALAQRGGDGGGDGGGEASLHLTIGFLEPSWAEALHDALDLLEPEEAALRAAFPTWRLTEPNALPALLRGMAEKLERLNRAAVLERVSVRMLDRLAGERMPLPGRGLLATPPGPTEPLRLAETSHHHVAAAPDGTATLRWGGGVEVLDAASLGWLERLEEGACAAELGEGALEFCRRLAALGLLERVPSSDTTAAVPRKAPAAATVAGRAAA